MIVITGAAISAPFAVQAAPINCDGTTEVMTVAGGSTTSKSFTTLSGSAFEFATDNGTSCVRVHFSAQVKTKSQNVVRIRVTLDNAPAGVSPASVDFSTANVGFDGRSASFVLSAVTGGSHTLRIQFLSFNGTAVTISKGVLDVMYTPGM